MNYEIFANLVMIFHTILIVSILLGILISVRYKRFRPAEAAVLLIAVIIWSLYGGCPLTYLENSLRTYAGNPLPLSQVGFIPFYLFKWFSVSVTNNQLVVTTYITAGIFLLTSIEWLSPFINPELIKVRKSLGILK